MQQPSVTKFGWTATGAASCSIKGLLPQPAHPTCMSGMAHSAARLACGSGGDRADTCVQAAGWAGLPAGPGDRALGIHPGGPYCSKGTAAQRIRCAFPAASQPHLVQHARRTGHKHARLVCSRRSRGGEVHQPLAWGIQAAKPGARQRRAAPLAAGPSSRGIGRCAALNGRSAALAHRPRSAGRLQADWLDATHSTSWHKCKTGAAPRCWSLGTLRDAGQAEATVSVAGTGTDAAGLHGSLAARPAGAGAWQRAGRQGAL